MAIIFEGSSECAICGKVLSASEDVVMLPAISNQDHCLYPYFDRGFHLQCFESWDRCEEVLKAVESEKLKFENSAYFKELTLKYGRPPGKT